MLGPLGMSEVLRPDHSHSKDHGYLGKGLSKYLLQDQVAQTRLIHFSECPAPWGFTKIGTCRARNKGLLCYCALSQTAKSLCGWA